MAPSGLTNSFTLRMAPENAELSWVVALKMQMPNQTRATTESLHMQSWVAGDDLMRLSQGLGTHNAHRSGS